MSQPSESFTAEPGQWKPHLTGVLVPQGFPLLPEAWTSEWRVDEGRFQTLYTRTSLPAGPLRFLFVVHGFGEHSGRYQHLPHFLGSLSGLGLVDLKGHGRSEGLRGHVDRISDFSQDLIRGLRATLERFLSYAAHRREEVEVHLMGHSMGGLVVLRTLFEKEEEIQELKVRSVLLSAPFLGLTVPPPLLKRIGAMILRPVLGSLTLESEIDPGVLSRDRAVIAAYLEDRLVHGRMSPQAFYVLNQAIHETRAAEIPPKWPILFLVPGDDQLVDARRTLELARAWKKKRKSLGCEIREFSHFRHELLNEIGKEQVFEEVDAWIRKHGTTNVN
jgi:lysophospholipase